jgi:phosphate transport system substrate-binding protein
MIRKTGCFGALLLVFALVAVACGDDDAVTTTTAPATTTTAATPTTAGDTTTTAGATGPFGLPIVDPLDIPAGDVAIAGSSTVFPLSTAVMTRWVDEGGPEYTIDSIGSGGGLERFCVEGASDIANASRGIKDDEVASCAAIDRTPIEIRVGTDALSIVISNGNYFAQALTLAELALLFSAEPGDTWDMVIRRCLIALYSPGADSGAFDYFTVGFRSRPRHQPVADLGNGLAEIVGEDDNLTVNGVADDGCTEGDLSSTCAAGYFGYAYYIENAGELQVMSVDGVEPNAETVNANDYPLSRPLFMYTDAGVIADKPQVALFIAYYLSIVNDVITEVGYFPAPDALLQEAAIDLRGRWVLSGKDPRSRPVSTGRDHPATLITPWEERGRHQTRSQPTSGRRHPSSGEPICSSSPEPCRSPSRWYPVELAGVAAFSDDEVGLGLPRPSGCPRLASSASCRSSSEQP